MSGKERQAESKPDESRSPSRFDDLGGLNLLDLSEQARAGISKLKEIDFSELGNRTVTNIKDFSKSLSDRALIAYENYRKAPDYSKDPEGFARESLSSYGLLTGTATVRVTAEALSKVYEKDPGQARKLLAEAKKEERYFGRSDINATEKLLEQVIELAAPSKELNLGWRKYDKIKASKESVLNEPLDNPLSHKRAAELLASILLDGGKFGRETVSEIRRSIHLPEYQGKLDLAVQDGKALAAIIESSGAGKTEAWKKLQEIDKNLEEAGIILTKSPTDENSMARAMEAFSQALKISPKATDLRLPYFSDNDPLGKAWSKALKQYNAKNLTIQEKVETPFTRSP